MNEEKKEPFTVKAVREVIEALRQRERTIAPLVVELDDIRNTLREQEKILAKLMRRHGVATQHDGKEPKPETDAGRMLATLRACGEDNLHALVASSGISKANGNQAAIRLVAMGLAVRTQPGRYKAVVVNGDAG